MNCMACELYLNKAVKMHATDSAILKAITLVVIKTNKVASNNILQR
jgi:hypothetical protein